ncbi:hypothetical protein APHAL10511_001251 [Amanita phalloides]|nr:hypothetical protein APHAL10511_001251 [Amanita phalloides]
MLQILDISYSSSSSPYHSFDLYLPSHSVRSSPLFCFVHGGAWRSEDKRDHADFARNIVLRSDCPVAVPNYHLTPKEISDSDSFRHPGHALDILECLTFLTSWAGPPDLGSVYDPSRIHLIGHSCAAHMLSSIFLDSSAITPCLAPTAIVLRSVMSIALAAGIYDIDLLLLKYPEYRSRFIEPAFGNMNSYSAFSVATYPLRAENIRWLIVHSPGDTLVDLGQGRIMYEHLRQIMVDDVGRRVEGDFHTCNTQHHDMFKDGAFLELLVKFALRE